MARTIYYYYLPFHFYTPPHPPPRVARDRWLSNPRGRRRGQEEPHLLQQGRGRAALALGRSGEVGHGDGPSLSLLPRHPPAPHVTGAGSRISCSCCAGNPARSAALRWRRGCATDARGSAWEVLPPPWGSTARRFIHRFLSLVESRLDLVESLCFCSLLK